MWFQESTCHQLASQWHNLKSHENQIHHVLNLALREMATLNGFRVAISKKKFKQHTQQSPSLTKRHSTGTRYTIALMSSIIVAFMPHTNDITGLSAVCYNKSTHIRFYDRNRVEWSRIESRQVGTSGKGLFDTTVYLSIIADHVHPQCTHLLKPLPQTQYTKQTNFPCTCYV